MPRGGGIVSVSAGQAVAATIAAAGLISLALQAGRITHPGRGIVFALAAVAALAAVLGGLGWFYWDSRPGRRS
jgi:hypothetical protein